MFLTRLIYTSTVYDECSLEDVESILESAHRNNKKNNLTGILAYNTTHFIQCLEGSRLQLNKTYKKIITDPRHHNLVIIDYQSIKQREFDSWSMGYVSDDKLEKTFELMRYAEELDDDFDPYMLTGQFAHEMLREFRTLVSESVR